MNMKTFKEDLKGIGILLLIVALLTVLIEAGLTMAVKIDTVQISGVKISQPQSSSSSTGDFVPYTGATNDVNLGSRYLGWDDNAGVISFSPYSDEIYDGLLLSQGTDNLALFDAINGIELYKNVKVVGKNLSATSIFANNLCYANGTNCQSSGGTYNATYDKWAYNQTTPAITDINNRFWNRTQSYNQTNINATNIKIGNISDGLLSTNIPKKNANNEFSGDNTFQSDEDATLVASGQDIFRFFSDPNYNYYNTPFALRWYDDGTPHIVFLTSINGAGARMDMEVGNLDASGLVTTADAIITNTLSYSSSDPELTVDYNVTSARALTLARASVPPTKAGGLAHFYNGSAMVYWKPYDCQYRYYIDDYTGWHSLSGDIRPLGDKGKCYSLSYKENYKFDPYENKTVKDQIPVMPYKLADGYSVNKTTGGIVKK